MKSIQEEIDKILSDNECCGEFGVWYEAVQKKVVKQLFQLFKTKWLEMVNSPIELGTFNSDEKDLDKLEQQIIGAMKLRAQLRQQISKEEI